MRSTSSRGAQLIRRTSVFVLMGLLPLGCASQDRYDQAVMANRSLKEQLTAAERDREAARADLTAAQGQLAQTQGSYSDLEHRYRNLDASVAGLDAANSDYMRRIAQLEMGPLPVEVESAIAELALMHPDVLSFDARMGLVRFSSDFTFDLGSIELKSDAAETLAALAAILDSPAARDLEARIIGHTDNVPIRRAETLRRHPTNTHLSVHRAIAVGDALTRAGVDAGRIQVAGYGEHRPIVANGPGGAAANRRVEIFLAPTADVAVQAMPEPVMEPVMPPTTIEPMK